MEPTLAQEERTIIPFIRAYYTPTDIQTLYQRVLAKSSKHLIGSFIHNMKRQAAGSSAGIGGHDDGGGDEELFGVDYFRNVCMKNETISNIVWYIHFQSNYEYYEREFVYKVQSIQKGMLVTPPKKSNTYMSRPVKLVAMIFFLILAAVILALYYGMMGSNGFGDHAISRIMNGMLFGVSPIKDHHHHHHRQHHHGYYNQQNK